MQNLYENKLTKKLLYLQRKFIVDYILTRSYIAQGQVKLSF